MAKKKTDAEFKRQVCNLVGTEYVFLDPYINKRTKIRVKHIKCGNTYAVTPNNFLRGHCCPYCYGNLKKTTAQFEKEIYDLVGNEYTLLDTYVNNKTKIQVKHNKCGHTYKVTPNAFTNGSRCPYCRAKANGEAKRKTNTEFQQEVFDLVGNEYIFLDTYVNNMTKIRVKHTKCGKIYEVTPANFLSGHGCPYCSGKAKKTDDQFQQEVYDLVGDEYTFLDTYINSKVKLRVKHNKCGRIYEVTPTDFFNKHSRCPYCNSPKGETLITKILDTLNIKYESQETFDDLKDIQPLSYDFYVPSQNILIEYQGIQHYEPIDYFGGDHAFKLQQKHDKMKLDYAKTHHYNLITVPYTEDTFSKIKKYLLKHGLAI